MNLMLHTELMHQQHQECLREAEQHRLARLVQRKPGPIGRLFRNLAATFQRRPQQQSSRGLKLAR